MEFEAVKNPMPLKPNFEPLKAHAMSNGAVQFRKIPVPSHRRKPLHNAWERIHELVYDTMKIDIRMNLKHRRVELKTRPDTPQIDRLQKCADFIQAIVLGFAVVDAETLLRFDELYVDTFEIKDVKTFGGKEHKSRAIGRLSGKGGRTRCAIENATRTRIVIADSTIHVLGSVNCIKVARSCLCSLILGSPAAKVYSKLRLLAPKLNAIA